MSKPSIIVSEVDVCAEADWRFRDSRPHWGPQRRSGSGVFDPFPAYAHPLAVVEEAAKFVEQMCPPLWDVELYVTDREEEGRSNGYSNLHEGQSYVDGEWVKDTPVGLIVLSGKRVPPHPSVTWYLVGHEYGHNVEWMLSIARGAKHGHDEALIAEYAKARGLPEAVMHHGSGGRWHDSVHEIFACDFRILVCDVESSYWPHPGIPHPHETDISDWWGDALLLLDSKRPVEAGAVS